MDKDFLWVKYHSQCVCVCVCLRARARLGTWVVGLWFPLANATSLTSECSVLMSLVCTWPRVCVCLWGIVQGRLLLSLWKRRWR